MPHYRDGSPVLEGDIVLVRAKVKTVYQAEDYCNVMLETLLPMHPDRNHGDSITLNTKQVDFVSRALVAPQPISPVGDLYVETQPSFGDDNE